jgi:hypothetical protein
MLLESDVIDAVCAKLESNGYTIRQRLGTTQHGDDIIAVKRTSPVRELFIEAKGETSSRTGSERFGKAFDGAQIPIHVAEAFYKSAKVLSRILTGVEVRAGIALPDNRGHRIALQNIAPVLSQLGIAVFWVTADGKVEVVVDWPL